METNASKAGVLEARLGRRPVLTGPAAPVISATSADDILDKDRHPSRYVAALSNKILRNIYLLTSEVLNL